MLIRRNRQHGELEVEALLLPWLGADLIGGECRQEQKKKNGCLKFATRMQIACAAIVHL